MAKKPRVYIVRPPKGSVPPPEPNLVEFDEIERLRREGRSGDEEDKAKKVEVCTVSDYLDSLEPGTVVEEVELDGDSKTRVVDTQVVTEKGLEAVGDVIETNGGVVSEDVMDDSGKAIEIEKQESVEEPKTGNELLEDDLRQVWDETQFFSENQKKIEDGKQDEDK
jgi:hypothetical protein